MIQERLSWLAASWLWAIALGAHATATAAEPAVPARAAGTPTIVVFAAASLTNALQEIGDDFGKSSGITVKFSFASSSVLARQIESGAPAEMFFSADLEWMDYLQNRKLIQLESRHDLLGNSLVLIAPATSPVTLKIEPQFQLAEALGTHRLATGDPDSVPAGRYAKAALTALGVWNSVEPHLVRADNVRSAMALVDRGEAPLGIVYKTDALVDKQVRIVDTFPAETHPPITYPLALTNNATANAAKFADYVRQPTADAVFVKYGFVPLH